MSRRFELMLPGTLDYHIRFLSEKNKPDTMMKVNLDTLSGIVTKIENAMISLGQRLAISESTSGTRRRRLPHCQGQ